MLVYKPVIQSLSFQNYQVDVLRLDLVDPNISGNKWFKLKHNLDKAKALDLQTIITFGGAFSNHIAATAAACKAAGFKCVGIIRGEAITPLNTTLQQAQHNGMQLVFVPRDAYAQKNTEAFKTRLQKDFGAHYLIPEGGNNAEGVLGCMEILKPGFDYDYIFCACGTGTTFAGLLAAASPGQTVVGINVLKGENTMVEETRKLLQDIFPGFNKTLLGNEALEKDVIENNCITNQYCFNGYAGFDRQLVDFKKQFETENNLPLDHIYTAKLFYAVSDLIQQQKLKPGAKVLVVHSGGLQGNAGFEARYFSKM